MKCLSTLRLRRLTACAAAAALLGLASSTANADLLWYDGFDTSEYTIDDGTDPVETLAGQAGGAGTFFVDPWIEQDTPSHIVLASSLEAAGQLVPSSPNGSVSDENPGGGCCQTGRSSRLFATPWNGRTPPEGTYYFGFLANFGTGSDIHHRAFEMHDSGFDDTANRNLMLGYSNFAGVGTDGNLGLVVKNVADNSSTSLSLANSPMDGRTHSYVLKFELSNVADSDSVSLFVDPPSFDEPGAASLEVLGTNVSFDRLSPIVNFIFLDDSTPSAFDELRVATTFTEAVIPIQIPEPASLLLLGIAALGMTARRRRG